VRISPRALSEAERQSVLEVLHTERFVDQPPREVYATLLAEGRYVCSVRTMYRVLASEGEVRERRNQRPPQHHPVPRLEARAPNQVWTWDITKLATLTPGVFLNLYLVLDLFSRFVVAWMVALRENSALAQHLIRQTIERLGIPAGQITLHNDRGAPMTAVSFNELLDSLGVEPSRSRPRVSNDNPYSESHFKTLKYRLGSVSGNSFDGWRRSWGLTRVGFSFMALKHSVFCYLRAGPAKVPGRPAPSVGVDA
jgi:putative transposase